MRVLFVIYGRLEQVSGGYLYDRQVIAYLRARGVEVDVLELPDRPRWLRPLRAFDGGLRRASRSGGKSGGDGGCDCLVIDELTCPSVFLRAALRSAKRPRMVTLVHHLRSREPAAFPRRAAARAMERILLRHSDALVVNSRATEASVRELVGTEVPVYLCRPGADAPAAVPRHRPAAGPIRRRGGVPSDGLPPDGKLSGEKPPEGMTSDGKPVRLLVTGNLIPRKGLHLLLPVLAGIRDLSWRLRVVGAWVDAPYKRRLDRLVRRLGLEARVCFTGLLSETDLAAQYREADIFVFPSRYEGFGISLAEAVRAGLPFVAFAAGGTAEAAGDGGMLVPDGDLDGFGRLLRELVIHPERRTLAAARSVELAAALPRWEDTGRDFLAALREVVRRP